MITVLMFNFSKGHSEVLLFINIIEVCLGIHKTLKNHKISQTWIILFISVYSIYKAKVSLTLLISPLFTHVYLPVFYTVVGKLSFMYFIIIKLKNHSFSNNAIKVGASKPSPNVSIGLVKANNIFFHHYTTIYFFSYIINFITT